MPATKARPILMHARSVNGIMDGTKTQTRRIVKPSRKAFRDCQDLEACWLDGDCGMTLTSEGYVITLGEWDIPVRCPFGQAGDRLYVREAMREVDGRLCWDADKKRVPLNRIPDGWIMKRAHVVGMLMPGWARRLTLEVISVRVERVQDISRADIGAEGCIVVATISAKPVGPLSRMAIQSVLDAATRKVWRDLWNDTNGKGAWERNDWTWVVEFKPIQN